MSGPSLWRRFAGAVGAGAAVVVTSIALVAACDDDLIARCGEIPPNGCPRNVDACSDPVCGALYVCRSGAWHKERDCPAHPPVDAASFDVVRDVAIDGAIKDVDIDVPGASGGPSCGPLQAPDCSLAAAAACPAGCCGCEDVFVCAGGAGWDLWGACTGEGVIKRP